MVLQIIGFIFIICLSVYMTIETLAVIGAVLLFNANRGYKLLSFLFIIGTIIMWVATYLSFPFEISYKG